MDSALDLYDGLSENAANRIVNNASSVKFIDLETWYHIVRIQKKMLLKFPPTSPMISKVKTYESDTSQKVVLMIAQQ
ncbi:MAG: hypothetical protein EZS28_004885 [Streblomastix strix]|uniref:Uncharacterized protein n=1 Tax=Streblomastix strix TaxID=222440 RepID=A0A5J4WX03_9EUKA|nr:MAG: hypothetical protein EZS28_004885 [Streblomastix strix]